MASILNEQRADGSWEVYHNAPAGDINTTVECYAALEQPGMRQTIRRFAEPGNGFLHAVDSVRPGYFSAIGWR